MTWRALRLRPPNRGLSNGFETERSILNADRRSILRDDRGIPVLTLGPVCAGCFRFMAEVVAARFGESISLLPDGLYATGMDGQTCFREGPTGASRKTANSLILSVRGIASAANQRASGAVFRLTSSASLWESFERS